VGREDEGKKGPNRTEGKGRERGAEDKHYCDSEAAEKVNFNFNNKRK